MCFEIFFEILFAMKKAIIDVMIIVVRIIAKWFGVSVGWTVEIAIAEPVLFLPIR